MNFKYTIYHSKIRIIMSIVFESENGWIISHLDYLHSIYQQVEDDQKLIKLEFNDQFFKVNSQYFQHSQTNGCKDNVKINISSIHKRNKRKNISTLPQNKLEQNNFVKVTSEKIIKAARNFNLFTNVVLEDNNEESRRVSKNFYSGTLGLICNYQGYNKKEKAVIAKLKNEKYVFPRCCQFFCKDIKQISEKVDVIGDYNLILMDPPWWNKSIRRKKIKFENSSYKMLYNEELAKIPIKNLLNSNSIVAIWCTNSSSNEKSILEEIFPSWGLTFQAKWFWLKITQNGYPICDFNDSHGKQPYEQIIFGSTASNKNQNIPDKKILISIPSAAHSHKPPLTEVLKPYLPRDPKCMEIFARYLLPEWTSWGLEVLKFQHLSLFSLAQSESKREESNVELKLSKS
ncbi:N(6)-adenine-specific methyltransferase METTL4 isoform X2 [Phymastichus coffea]|uniref:N(6)-adenine-specific methyltransferase METTL4 isoform X2 n=1 Tax=Phymastichus coffea TaxID=108790 RepID=UPI00273C9E2E|nr:N(6)-adenine-specific methyltransferase METTL4 isoform X2 [Phymastichus coffea]